MSHILNVPYYSQFEYIEDCTWQPRACGVACVKMILDHYRAAPYITMHDLLLQSSDINAYGKDGWKHQSLSHLFRSAGVNSYCQEFISLGYNPFQQKQTKSITEEWMHLYGYWKIVWEVGANKPVIVSMRRDFRPGRGSHLIVIIGFSEGDRPTHLIAHDPDPRQGSGEKTSISVEDFIQNWTRRAIFIETLNQIPA